MAASPKRICEQCRREFLPERDQLTAIVTETMITITARHLEDEPEFCSRACRLEFVGLAEARIGKRIAEAREYSPERLERMVKE